MWPGMPKLHKRINCAISLQYLKKELSDEVSFLLADQHKTLLQVESMILMDMVKHSQSSNFAISLQ